MKIAIKDLTFDRSIYPRREIDWPTVEAYRMAHEAGATFPPGEVQRVNNFDPSDPERIFTLVIDCAHRASAFTEYGIGKPLENEIIEVEYWQEEVLDYQEHWQALAERGLELAKRQPKNLVAADKKSLARRMAERKQKKELTEESLAKLFEVPRLTIHEWIKDIRARQMADRNSIILRLHLLGWKQEDIGQAVGLGDRQLRREIGQNVDFNKMSAFLAEGKSIEEAAEICGYDLTLAWALRMRDMSDQEIAQAVADGGQFEKAGLGFKMLPYDYWPPGGKMELAGRDHPSKIPGRIIMNTLYFFTERGEMVIDPMAGGGVTADCCLLMGRRNYSYDIDLRWERPDILEHDLADGWPDRTKKADLIFLDPPYFKKMDDKYVEGSISSLSREDYLAFLEAALADAASIVKKGTRLAFLMSDWTDDEDPAQGIFIWDYANLIQKAGWNIIRHIQRPLPLTQIHPDIANKLRDSKRLGRLNRYLLVANV